MTSPAPRATLWAHTVDTIAADARLGARRLRRSPASAAVIALTLALGIGSSTAIFSAVHPILIQPLPYPGADRLMMIWDRQGAARLDVTFGTYREIVERNRSFESMAVMKPLQVTLTGTSEPERINGQSVSADYFRVLGMSPAAGRNFEASDDRSNGPSVCIISDGLWRRRFGADPAVIGRPVTMQGYPVTIVGVMPRGFENVLSPSAEIWSPLQYDTALPLDGREWGHHLRLVGRLKPGASPEHGRQELDAIGRTTLAAFPRPPWAALEAGLIAEPLQDDITRDVRPALTAVLGAVVLLLVISCVNVAGLLLARGVERRTELAVRAALGASRLRLMRQTLVETLLLAAAGGALGVLLARFGVNVITMLAPLDLPRADAIQLNRAALLFALALSATVGVGLGILPALHWSDTSLIGAIQRRSPRVAGGRHTARRALVVVQVALAFTLLVGAGLLVRSVQRVYAQPPGFDPAHVLTMQVQTAGPRFRDDHASHRFFTQVLEAVQRVPGVSAAAFTSLLPLTGDQDVWGVHFESAPASAAEEDPDGYRYAVSPGYLEAMGIPLRAGRTLSARDVAGAVPVAVINESLARRRLPGLEPLGQRVRIGAGGQWYTVVGVVGDVKQTSLDTGLADAVYVTAAQWRFADGARWLVVRAERDVPLAAAVRSAIWSIDRDQPILRVATMAERLQASESERRFVLTLLETFGVIALVLATIAIYGLLSGGVTERTHEIGIRSALGASRSAIVALVLGQGMTLAALGIVLGLAGAAAASGALVTLLFGVSRLDTATYLGGVALLIAVSAAACTAPAWRAARIQPTLALRSE